MSEGDRLNRLATVNGLLLEVFKVEKSSKYLVQLGRSLIVSAVALAVDFAILVGLKQGLGLNYLVAATISYSIGVVVNYTLSVAWVFTERQLASQHVEFALFVAITLIGLVFNFLIIAGLVELVNIDYRIAKLVSTVIVFFWNFIARKKILY